jgi:hypothetical protein
MHETELNQNERRLTLITKVVLKVICVIVGSAPQKSRIVAKVLWEFMEIKFIAKCAAGLGGRAV